MALEVRKASEADLGPAAAMETRAWREAYQGLLGPSIFEHLAHDAHGISSHWADLMHQGHDFWIVADGDEVVGVCHAGPARDDDAPTPVEMDTLYVLQQVKGTGMSRQLMEAALQQGPAYLWVLKGNERAIAFYEKNGFVADGVTREIDDMQGAVELRMVRSQPVADAR